MRRVELETNPSYITVQPSRTCSADYKYNSQYIINVTLILTSLKRTIYVVFKVEQTLMKELL